MSENNRSDDNEIDIIEIIGILWDGKWLISSVVVIVTLIGFVYSQVRQPIYSVSVPFSVNKISPITNKKMCEIDYCLATLLNSGWSLEKKNITQLSQSTTNPLSINEYEAQLERANKVITNLFLFLVPLTLTEAENLAQAYRSVISKLHRQTLAKIKIQRQELQSKHRKPSLCLSRQILCSS